MNGTTGKKLINDNITLLESNHKEIIISYINLHGGCRGVHSKTWGL